MSLQTRGVISRSGIRSRRKKERKNKQKQTNKKRGRRDGGRGEEDDEEKAPLLNIITSMSCTIHNLCEKPSEECE